MIDKSNFAVAANGNDITDDIYKLNGILGVDTNFSVKSSLEIEITDYHQ